MRRTAKRCKREGFEFDLDDAWYIERLKAGVCELTGLPFDLSATLGPYSPSIDRIIAGTGYTKRNCRVVLHCLNFAMGNWGIAAFLPVARALIERNCGNEHHLSDD